MSEYLDAEIHETIDHLEIRWRYEEKEYALTITPEMFDLLAVAEGQDAPILAKLITNPAAWTNKGLEISGQGFTLV